MAEPKTCLAKTAIYYYDDKYRKLTKDKQDIDPWPVIFSFASEIDKLNGPIYGPIVEDKED